jgi:AbrB family looped-hinge helix DNA binding protein
MQFTLLSSKGQVIIPKALREAHQWQAGTRLQVLDTGEGLLLKPVSPSQKVPLAVGLAAIRERIAYLGAPVSLEEMDAAVLQEARRRSPR